MLQIHTEGKHLAKSVYYEFSLTNLKSSCWHLIH